MTRAGSALEPRGMPSSSGTFLMWYQMEEADGDLKVLAREDLESDAEDAEAVDTGEMPGHDVEGL